LGVFLLISVGLLLTTTARIAIAIVAVATTTLLAVSIVVVVATTISAVVAIVAVASAASACVSCSLLGLVFVLDLLLDFELLFWATFMNLGCFSPSVFLVGEHVLYQDLDSVRDLCLIFQIHD
jgi:hypothetical protein